MESKPIIPVPVETDDLADFLEKVKEEIKYLDAHYESVYDILQDALKGAMRWAPAVVMRQRTPSVKELRELGIQALTICYCTERFERNS